MPKISEEEFFALLREKRIIEKTSRMYELDEIPDKVYQDLAKVEFDFENRSCSDNFGKYTKSLIGIHQTKSGITFLGCNAGGDWEQPVFFLIYWDGKEFRGYVPKEGNVYDKKKKIAFGNEDEDEEDFDAWKNFNESEILKDIEQRFEIY
jgi:hypothetical protein